ncbi:MAG: DUF2155 domain-containing protein [Brevundimonas sp.]|nr:MAG: DUF2155 domain-containing protein [Brevundimonas sp.]
MSRARAWVLTGVIAASLGGAGAVGARALQDTPAEARPADPIGDILRTTPSTPETAPAATPAPVAPVVVAPADPVVTAQVEEKADEAKAEEEKTAAPAAPEEAPPPGRRTRRPIAVVQAIDKITAESMRFEVEVGGRPVRFDKTLIVSARACEVAASDEVVNDSVAYLDISVQPRGAQSQEPRQIFRGWMFASTPAVSGLQHPVYDAWVVGCKA